jgi:Fur family ferric uptake transcriptional regulator
MILEFENDEIERLQEKMAADLGGFKVLHHKHELYCLCPKAQGIPGGSCPHERASER